MDQVIAEFEHELTDVRRLLASSLNELPPPLRVLVQAQLEQTFSHRRVGVTLAAGVGMAETARLREQRICIAAALEMLYLALGIHHLLLINAATTEVQSLEKSWVGSVILAGDYCFSRSAMLTAQTDHPQVVEIFARSLKVVSEDQVRRWFQAEPLGTAGAHELVHAGLTSAAILAAHPQPIVELVTDLGSRLMRPPATNAQEADQSTSALLAALIEQLPVGQQARWRLLLTWPLPEQNFSPSPNSSAHTSNFAVNTA
jgi:hypothetical protein